MRRQGVLFGFLFFDLQQMFIMRRCIECDVNITFHIRWVLIKKPDRKDFVLSMLICHYLDLREVNKLMTLCAHTTFVGDVMELCTN